jgi:hypothetical protein
MDSDYNENAEAEFIFYHSKRRCFDSNKKKKPTPAKQRRKLKICEMTYHSKSYSNDIENE